MTFAEICYILPQLYTTTPKQNNYDNKEENNNIKGKKGKNKKYKKNKGIRTL